MPKFLSILGPDFVEDKLRFRLKKFMYLKRWEKTVFLSR